MAALRFTRNQAAQYLTEQGLPTSPEVLRRLAINGDVPLIASGARPACMNLRI